MILVDTSGVLAALFPGQRRHRECATVLNEHEGPLLLSPFVLAELDYLIAKYADQAAEVAFMEEVAAEAYSLAPFNAHDVGEAKSVVQQFSDLEIGLADASLVVLSRRWKTLDLLTLDERHFRTLRGAADEPFRILPVDS